MTIDEITRRLQPVLAGHPDIEAVFLFGAHATGSPRPDSAWTWTWRWWDRVRGWRRGSSIYWRN
jgi:hypothetical protein